MTARAKKIRYSRYDAIARKLPSILERWNINFISRRHLLELDDGQLLDIGIDRVTAMQEARKPFWRS